MDANGWWTGNDDRPGLDPEPEQTEYCSVCNIALGRVAIRVTVDALPYVHLVCSDVCEAELRARLEVE